MCQELEAPKTRTAPFSFNSDTTDSFQMSPLTASLFIEAWKGDNGSKGLCDLLQVKKISLGCSRRAVLNAQLISALSEESRI